MTLFIFPYAIFFVVLQTEKSVLVGSTNAINIFWKHTDQVYIEKQ